MVITAKHWQAFGLIVQNKRGYMTASEIMRVPAGDVKRLLREMKELEPDLFPIDCEKHNLSKQIHKKERSKFKMGVCSYDASKEKSEFLEDEIILKF